MTRRRIIGAMVAGALAAGSGLAAAQAFPSKPIRIVVPFPPGGTTDIMARAMATQMNLSLGVPVLVENRVGGSAIVGTDHVARAAPDGYTLLMAGSPHGINNSLRKNFGNYLVVNGSLGWWAGEERQHRFQVRLVNILNEKYAERYGYGNQRFSSAFVRGEITTSSPNYFYGYPFEGKPRAVYVSYTTTF